MSVPHKSVTIRIPGSIRDRLRRQAAENRRSMNSEIVHCLDQAIEAQDEKGPTGAATPPGHDHDNSPTTEKANELARE